MASTSPGHNMTSSSSDISRAPRIVFLLTFVILTATGNIIILTVIAIHRKLRTSKNILIANLSLVCLIDAFLNMSLVLGALVVDEWLFGEFVCKLNSFFFSLVNILTLALLASLTADRFLSVVHSKNRSNPRCGFVCKISLVLVCLWSFSLAFTTPFLTDLVTSEFRAQLHLCAMTEETEVTFVYITLLVCFLTPLVAIFILHILIIRLDWKMRVTKRAEEPQKNYTQMVSESSTHTVHTTKSSSHPSSYTRVLLLSWLVLDLPFLITSYIKHYQHSQSDDASFLNYPWEVDAAFIWMKFFFSALFPIVTMSFNKDLWQSTKECVFCRRNNSVIDSDALHSESVDANTAKEKSVKVEVEFSTPKTPGKDKSKSEMSPSILAFSIPVLFATSYGMRVEEQSSDYLRESSLLTSEHLNFDSVASKGKRMDITYDDQEVVADTSDYDSICESDQLSNSQPVSTRNVHGLLGRSRSLSDPEITSPALHSDKLLSNTSGADSGLDLSGNSGKHSRKSISGSMPLDSPSTAPGQSDSQRLLLHSSSFSSFTAVTTKEAASNSCSVLVDDAPLEKCSFHSDLSSTNFRIGVPNPTQELIGNCEEFEEIELSQYDLPTRCVQKENYNEDNLSDQKPHQSEHPSLDASPSVPQGDKNPDTPSENLSLGNNKTAKLPPRLKPIVSSENETPKSRKRKVKHKKNDISNISPTPQVRQDSRTEKKPGPRRKSGKPSKLTSHESIMTKTNT